MSVLVGSVAKIATQVQSTTSASSSRRTSDQSPSPKRRRTSRRSRSSDSDHGSLNRKLLDTEDTDPPHSDSGGQGQVETEDHEGPPLNGTEKVGTENRNSPPARDEPIPDSVLVVDVDSDLDENCLQMLGDVGREEVTAGPPVHKDIVSRFEHFATKGLMKEEFDTLMKKYVVPSNCLKISPPKLNQEIQVTIPDWAKERDCKWISLQQQLTSGLTAQMRAMEVLMSKKNAGKDLTQGLNDLSHSSRIFMDLQYKVSQERRHLLSSSVKSAVVKEVIKSTVVDSMLFGEDLGERIKTHEDLQKLGRSLGNKPTAKSSYREGAGKPRSAHKVPLNSQGPPRRYYKSKVQHKGGQYYKKSGQGHPRDYRKH